MRSSSIVVGAVALLGAAACSGGAAGSERHACRKTATPCDPGLVCMSELCVRPPPADCGAVADSLVSLELGNYAAPEDRARLVPTKRALCERHKVSADEATCLGKAPDVWAASACVPRMFPKLAEGDCGPVIAKLRSALAGEMGASGDREMVDKVMNVLARSCEEDRWPAPFRRCILAADLADKRALDRCEDAMPPGLKDKVNERMRDATR